MIQNLPSLSPQSRYTSAARQRPGCRTEIRSTTCRSNKPHREKVKRFIWTRQHQRKPAAARNPGAGFGQPAARRLSIRRYSKGLAQPRCGPDRSGYIPMLASPRKGSPSRQAALDMALVGVIVRVPPAKDRLGLSLKSSARFVSSERLQE